MTKRKTKNPTAVHANHGQVQDTKTSAKRTRSSRVKAAPETTSAEAISAETAPATTLAAPSAKKWARSGEMSALDAAAKVLTQTGQPMTCQEMIDAMAKKGYWTSPGGRTPAATLYSALLRELKTKGNEARFLKTERGKFTRK